MKKNIKNFPASIKEQLKGKAKEINCSFSEILQYYGIERFLYRFSHSRYADKFILKGALLFNVWEITERRTTLDIDFLADYDNQVSLIEDIVKDVCRINVEPDGLIFDTKTIVGKRIKLDADYEGVRVKFIGFLERSRIPMQIDMSFDDVICTKPSVIKYPVILDYPRPYLRGYPIESVISEKFEAMIKLGLLNSRMKDFYDIYLLIHKFEFVGLKLTKAIKGTFEYRKTSYPQHKLLFADEIYDEKSDQQVLWKAFLEKQNIKYAPIMLSEVTREIEKFLIEPLESIKTNQQFSKIWKPSGPWK